MNWEDWTALKTVHINDVPSYLIRRRDAWRNFWQWVPILGEVYRTFWYVRAWDKWSNANQVAFISHE